MKGRVAGKVLGGDAVAGGGFRILQRAVPLVAVGSGGVRTDQGPAVAVFEVEILVFEKLRPKERAPVSAFSDRTGPYSAAVVVRQDRIHESVPTGR